MRTPNAQYSAMQVAKELEIMCKCIIYWELVFFNELVVPDCEEFAACVFLVPSFCCGSCRNAKGSRRRLSLSQHGTIRLMFVIYCLPNVYSFLTTHKIITANLSKQSVWYLRKTFLLRHVCKFRLKQR